MAEQGYEQPRLGLSSGASSSARRAQAMMSGKHSVLREIGLGTNDPQKSVHLVKEATGASFMVDRVQTGAFGGSFISRKARGSTTTLSAVADGDDLCTLWAFGYAGATNGYVDCGWVQFEVDGSVSDASYGVPTRMIIKTSNGSSFAERIRVDKDGNVGIGVTPSQKLHVAGNVQLNARGEVRFADSDSSHYTGIKSAATVSSSHTYTLPAAFPASNKLLQSTDAGVLSWEDAGSGSGDITGVTIETDSGSGSKASDTGGSADFTLLGGSGVDVTNSSATITVAGEDATTSNKGVASFHSDNFSVSSGAVTIKDQGVAYAEIQNVSADERILGRVSGANGVIEELTKSNVLTMLSVEDGADVTDATNVTAAGALMDSEVTNLAFVKALAKGISDGNVLTANDAVADDDFLRINGTEVEGLTVAEVLTALNVEAGATADQSNAEIVAAVEAGTDSNTFTDADHSKLNGIEASADVTDATNVTAAGALMDSEVTNLAFVKALAKGISDGNVLTANDVVADDDFLRINGTEVEGLTVAEVLTALNVEAGADVTDATNVTAAGALMDSELAGIAAVKATTGTFLSADESKLDGIEAGATADQTAGEILTLLEDEIDSVHYKDGSIDEVHLNATNSPTDNYILSYDSGSSGFTWVQASSGSGGGVSLSGTTNNTVATVTGSDALAGEANLTFDGSALTVTGNVFVDGGADVNQVKIQGHSTQNASILLVENSGGTDVFEVTNTGKVIGASGAEFKGNSFTMGSSGGSTNFIHASGANNLNFRNANASKTLNFDISDTSGELKFRTHDGSSTAVTQTTLDSAGVWTHNVAMVATGDAVFKGDTDAELFVVDAGAERVGVSIAAGSMKHRFDCRGSRGYAVSQQSPSGGSGAYTLTEDDAIIHADAGALDAGGTLTITLPTIAKGRIYEIYRRDDGSGGQTVVVAAPSGTNLNGTDAGTVSLGTQHEGVRIVGISATDDWIAHEMHLIETGGGGGGGP